MVRALFSAFELNAVVWRCKAAKMNRRGSDNLLGRQGGSGEIESKCLELRCFLEKEVYALR